MEAGDFLIRLPPSTTNGEGVNVDLEKPNQTTENESYYIGYPVVTDDEGKGEGREGKGKGGKGKEGGKEVFYVLFGVCMYSTCTLKQEYGGILKNYF